VVAGTVVSALDFAWKQSADLSISSISVDKARRKVYTVKGPLFFGSTGKFSTLFDSKRDPDQVVLDFSSCRVWDHSALEAIHDTVDKYGAQGKTVFLRNLSDEMADVLAKSHPSGSLLVACVHRFPISFNISFQTCLLHILTTKCLISATNCREQQMPVENPMSRTMNRIRTSQHEYK
jgi:MFS superfamily sulfate permease-like transporter